MYHNKELERLNPKVLNLEPVAEGEKEIPILSKIRFGDLAIGDKFFFNGCKLVKISEYGAENDQKTNKRQYLFFKKDVVKHERFGMVYCPYIPIVKDGCTQPTKDLPKGIDRFDKNDFFNDHYGLVKEWEDRESRGCIIVITPGYDGKDPKADGRHNIDVIEGDYSWSTGLIGDLDLYWSVMIRLKKVILNLVYGDNEIKLLHLGREVWSRRLECGWSGINCCTITIKDIRLERSETNSNFGET